MTGENQGQQTQNQGQIPDHRFQEVYANMKRLEQQNLQYRDTIDKFMSTMSQQRQPQPVQEESPFTPEIQKALTAEMQKQIDRQVRPLAEQFQQNLGMLHDSQDRLSFQSLYGTDIYTKYQDKITSLRQERSRQGQWLSNEDAYKFIQADEMGKQAKQNPKTVTPASPQIDPYTGQAINPAPAIMPVQQVAQAAPVQAQSDFMLPPQGVTMGEQVPVVNQQTKLNTNMSEKDLDTWAQNYSGVKF
jgi:hypothetical protein